MAIPATTAGVSSSQANFASESSKSSDPCSRYEPSSGSTNMVGQVDVWVIVCAAHNYLDQLGHISEDMADAQKMKYLFFGHFRPSSTDIPYSHAVTKKGRFRNAHFQL